MVVVGEKDTTWGINEEIKSRAGQRVRVGRGLLT